MEGWLRKVKFTIHISGYDRDLGLDLICLDPGRINQSSKEAIEGENARLTRIDPIERSLAPLRADVINPQGTGFNEIDARDLVSLLNDPGIRRQRYVTCRAE